MRQWDQSKSRFVEHVVLHLFFIETNFHSRVLLKKNLLFESSQDFWATLYFLRDDSIIILRKTKKIQLAHTKYLYVGKISFIWITSEYGYQDFRSLRFRSQETRTHLTNRCYAFSNTLGCVYIYFSYYYVTSHCGFPGSQERKPTEDSEFHRKRKPRRTPRSQ